MSKATFEQWIQHDELLEHAMVYGDYKGIPMGPGPLQQRPCAWCSAVHLHGAAGCASAGTTAAAELAARRPDVQVTGALARGTDVALRLDVQGRGHAAQAVPQRPSSSSWCAR